MYSAPLIFKHHDEFNGYDGGTGCRGAVTPT
jgi:hypothetical protein